MRISEESGILLEARHISYSNPQTIIQDVSLALREGEILTLIGPNGAGKTTLVRIILGLLNPTQGQIIRRAKLRIGYMPQKLQLDQNLPLSVKHFLRLGSQRRSGINRVLAETKIEHLANHPLSQVSGGELQRVLLARALLREPHLLVLDEPVQGVDVNGQSELYGLINRIRQQYRCGVLMVSHDLHLVMANTDTVVCLNQHVCCQGHPDDISHDPAFLSLFGEQHSTNLAVYTHHHDHHHDLHGDIVEDHHCSSGDH